MPVLDNANESRDSSRDIRNAPVTLISGLPAVSNSALALAALLVKCVQTTDYRAAVCASP